jgi:L-ascorbate metabolism protein UlaG (beta-lactamase superfamily)
MDKKQVYLKPNLVPEPLVDQWYAWPHLIAPAASAMNVANSHVKIMKSFVAAPAVHAAAVKNPAMRGGPFLDLDASRVGEVKALLDRTFTEQGRLIELASAIESLNLTLANEAQGASLEPLYEKTPETLRGFVELVYDLNHHPSFRLIERLLYRSAYYDESRQSLDVSLTDKDDRPFVFSTPRLKEPGHIQLNMPFSSEALDELFRMRERPQASGYIKELLGVEGDDAQVVDSMITEEAPQAPARRDIDRPRVRYFGHACVLVESRGLSVLTDPVISYAIEGGVARYTYSDLPERIDYALISHGHSDHLVFESLLQLRHKIRNVIVPRSGSGALEDPSLKLVLENTGFKNVMEIDEMETVDVGGLTITGLPFLGEHADLNIRSKIAYLIDLNGKSVLCAADSANLEVKLYERIHALVGDVDTLFLGMECDGAPLSWIYGQLLTKPIPRKMDQSRRLSGSDYKRALDIVTRFNCSRVYVYAMGQEPWLSFLTSIRYTDESKPIIESNKLVGDCRERGIEAERLYGSKEIFL